MTKLKERAEAVRREKVEEASTKMKRKHERPNMGKKARKASKNDRGLLTTDDLAHQNGYNTMPKAEGKKKHRMSAVTHEAGMRKAKHSNY